jgi:hypothetical protein
MTSAGKAQYVSPAISYHIISIQISPHSEMRFVALWSTRMNHSTRTQTCTKTQRYRPKVAWISPLDYGIIGMSSCLCME